LLCVSADGPCTVAAPTVRIVALIEYEALRRGIALAPTAPEHR